MQSELSQNSGTPICSFADCQRIVGLIDYAHFSKRYKKLALDSCKLASAEALQECRRRRYWRTLTSFRSPSFMTRRRLSAAKGVSIFRLAHRMLKGDGGECFGRTVLPRELLLIAPAYLHASTLKRTDCRSQRRLADWASFNGLLSRDIFEFAKTL
jgi:hypothetical protein